MRESFFNYSFDDLKNLFCENDLPLSGASLLYNWHYKKRKTEACSENLAKKTISHLAKNLSFELPQIDSVQESTDRTVKFLFKLRCGKKVETVLIPFHQKYSICLSSQVGCAMNCSFCYTGTQGFSRQLDCSEIIGQFLQAQIWLTKNRPNDDKVLNIVFMGQGEPLHNFNAVKKACEIFLSQHGLSIAREKITISTAGYLPGLKRWKEEMPDVNIALSFHSPFTEKRNKLIPINQKYPLNEVLQFVDDIPQGKNRFVTYEYLLIKDFNDSEEDAIATGEMLRGKNGYINLIPFNPFPGSNFERPSDNQLDKFKSIIDSYKIPALIRKTKGDEILAACGQLNTKT